MRKFITDVFDKYNFRYDGMTGYGKIHGYQVNIFTDPNVGIPVIYIASYLSIEQKELFINKIDDCKFKMVQASSWGYGVTLKIRSSTIFSFDKKVEEVFDVAFKVLEEMQAPKADICPASGMELTETNSKEIVLPTKNFRVRVINGVVDELNESIDKSNENFKNAKGNYLAGFFGIVLGTIIGLVAFYILYLIGLLSALTAVLAMYLGTFFYKKFGGKPDAVMICMSFVVTLFAFLGFVFLLYVDLAETLAAAEGLVLESGSPFSYYMDTYPEFEKEYSINLGLTALFTIIGGVSMIGTLVKSVKRPNRID